MFWYRKSRAPARSDLTPQTPPYLHPPSTITTCRSLPRYIPACRWISKYCCLFCGQIHCFSGALGVPRSVVFLWKFIEQSFFSRLCLCTLELFVRFFVHRCSSPSHLVIVGVMFAFICLILNSSGQMNTKSVFHSYRSLRWTCRLAVRYVEFTTWKSCIFLTNTDSPFLGST